MSRVDIMWKGRPDTGRAAYLATAGLPLKSNNPDRCAGLFFPTPAYGGIIPTLLPFGFRAAIQKWALFEKLEVSKGDSVDRGDHALPGVQVYGLRV